jgi:ATP-dependent Clp protease ATP-binding subunit ClpA
MFGRFTESARQVIVLAQQATGTLGSDCVGTEHLLLGIAEESEGLGGRVLESLGVTAERVREEVPRTVGSAQTDAAELAPRGRQVPFSQQAKVTLELALRESLSLGHDYIGSEHLLLGLIREGNHTALRVLDRCGLKPDLVRERTLAMAKEAQEGRGRTVDMDRSWLDFTAEEALMLTTRLTPLASRISLEVRRHGSQEPTFRISCELLAAKHVLRDLVSLEDDGIIAILGDRRSVRLGHRCDTDEQR